MRIVGLGAGSHARAIIEALQSVGAYIPVAVADDDETRVGTNLQGVPVVRVTDLPSAEYAFVGVGGIKDATPRINAYRRLSHLGYELPPIVHAFAIVSPLTRIHAGVQVLAGAIINANAAVGAGAIINTGAIIEHDCSVGAHAHVAPGATLGGGARVGFGAHVGLGACVLEGVRIGTRALVGAGAVVLHDVPDGVWVAGVPAQPIKGHHDL